jgi:hypothetical protein
VGVALIPPEEGMPTYILHYSPGAKVSLGWTLAYGTVVPVPPEGYEAVLCGAERSTDPTTQQNRLRLLQKVVDVLSGYDIPIAAYVAAPGFAVDENGWVYWTSPPTLSTAGYEP